eukprot:scaffold2767_cov177-Amphora_coffeaeformis.AAC.49
MSTGEKRKLTEEERIRFEEEERFLKASRGILEDRLALVKDELDSAQIQERQLKDQIETMGSQLKTQKENRSRQIALQLELNKNLSKTRDAYMKVVTESMDSGNLSQAEGLRLIVDETIKEIFTLDDMGRPHANHRCRGLRNTCLSISSFFPPSNTGGGPGEKDDVDPVTSTCPRYINEGFCNEDECPHHQSGEPRVPPQLDVLPDPNLPDTRPFDEGEIPYRGETITAWWLNNDGRITLPPGPLPFTIHTVLQSIGLRVANRKLLLENASSERASATLNVARYVDGYRLALHAGLMAAPFDLNYLVAALEDLSFSASVIGHVKNCFAEAAASAYDSPSDAYIANFEVQLGLVKALFLFEKGRALFEDNTPVDEACIDAICDTWKKRKEELAAMTNLNARREAITVTLVPICRAVKQALGRAAVDVRQIGSWYELKKLHVNIEEALFALLHLAFDDTFSQILLAPLFAGNIALACSLRLFHKAHSCLDTLLNYGRANVPESGVNFFILSQLLWSQLVQLRICLPPIGIHSEELADYKVFLDGIIDELGIRLRRLKPVVGRVK